MSDAPHATAAWSAPGAMLRQLTGVLGGPVIWLTQFELNYAFVGPACAAGSRLRLHLVSLASVLLVLGCGALAWRGFVSAGRAWPDDAPGGPVGRSRLLGGVGLFSGALFLLVILAQWAATIMIDPCR